MNACRFAAGSAALSAVLMAGCGDPSAPAAQAQGSAKDGAHVTVVVLGSGTSSVQGLRAAADFTPGDPVVDTVEKRSGVAFGAGLKPSRGASGISP